MTWPKKLLCQGDLESESTFVTGVYGWPSRAELALLQGCGTRTASRNTGHPPTLQRRDGHGDSGQATHSTAEGIHYQGRRAAGQQSDKNQNDENGLRNTCSQKQMVQS